MPNTDRLQYFNWMNDLIEAEEYEEINIVTFLDHFEISQIEFETNIDKFNLDIFTYYNPTVIFSGDQQLIESYYAIENEPNHVVIVQTAYEQYVNIHGEPDKDWMLPIPVIVQTTDMLAGSLGLEYDFTLEATGTEPITWQIISGSMPPGLRFDPHTGSFSDTPAVMGEFTFTVQATNAAGSVTEEFTIEIGDVPAPGWPVIQTLILPLATSTNYPFNLSALGTPVTWSIVSGSLPLGMSITGRAGTISGHPSGYYLYHTPYTITFQAENPVGTTTRTLTLVVPGVSGSEDPDAYIGVQYVPMQINPDEDDDDDVNIGFQSGITQTTASVTEQAPSWVLISGILPPGLNLNETTGVISGIPVEVGVFEFTIQMTKGVDVTTFVITIEIIEAELGTMP
jgi:hypothetical protein